MDALPMLDQATAEIQPPCYGCAVLSAICLNQRCDNHLINELQGPQATRNKTESLLDRY